MQGFMLRIEQLIFLLSTKNMFLVGDIDRYGFMLGRRGFQLLNI